MRRADGRARRSVGGALVLTAVVAGVLAWAVVVQSPLFDIRRVDVRGNGRLAEADVEALLPEIEGRNLLLLSLERMEERVRENPWIAHVEARRRLPSTLVVRVREHVPVAWVRGPSGGTALAADGTVLGRRKSRGLVSLGRTSEEMVPGSRARVDDLLLRVVGSMAPRVRRQVTGAVLGDEGVVLRMRSGAKILFGDGAGIPAKQATLEALLRWMGENGVPAGTIDLRAPASPAIRPVSGEAPSSPRG